MGLNEAPKDEIQFAGGTRATSKDSGSTSVGYCFCGLVLSV